MAKIPLVKQVALKRTLFGALQLRVSCPGCKEFLTCTREEVGKPTNCSLCGQVFMLSPEIEANIEGGGALKQVVGKTLNRIKTALQDWSLRARLLRETHQAVRERERIAARVVYLEKMFIDAVPSVYFAMNRNFKASTKESNASLQAMNRWYDATVRLREKYPEPKEEGITPMDLD